MTARSLSYGLVGMALLAPAWAQRSATATQTAADVLKQKLDNGENLLVIDVRTDEEVATGSIPGAIHIPMEQLEARMKDVPRDIELVFT
jgi:rhodanese-related sulfurtransferase